MSMTETFQNLFKKVCVNATPSTRVTMDPDTKKPVKKPMRYRRDDLSKWAEEAFHAKKHYFYTEPVNPKNPNGRLRLCEPKYVYQLKHELSEEEYQNVLEALQALETP